MTFATSPGTTTPGQLLPLYPMTVADVLDGAFRAWRAVIAVVTLTIVLVTGPVEIIGSLLLYRAAPELLLQSIPADPITDLGTLGGAFLLSIVSGVVSVYAACAILEAILQADRGSRPSLGAALARAIRPAFMALVALLLVGIAAFVLMFVAALIVAITFGIGAFVVVPMGVIVGGAVAAVAALTLPIAVSERRGPLAVLGRAVWVLRVRFWRTIGISLLVLILLVGITAGASFLLELLAVASGPAAWVVISVGQLVVSLVSLPIASIAALLVLLDARMLNEGYDLEVRIDRLATA